jgi:hypothetical protein
LALYYATLCSPHRLLADRTFRTEKDVTEHATQLLRKMLETVTFDNAINVDNVVVDGEAFLYNRKGKKYLSFDLKITISWSGKTFASTLLAVRAHEQRLETFVDPCVLTEQQTTRPRTQALST